MPKIQEPIKVFNPLPWQVPVWRDKSFILLCTGSAGGGKSRILAEKMHARRLKYPKSMGVMVRKTRESMTNSTVLFMQKTVIGDDPRVTFVPSKNRFEYDNGSILAYGGMKDHQQREQIRSIGIEGGLDDVWMEEASQFTIEDYEELIARLRGKRTPWRQLMLSTNPDTPQHWIYKHLMIGGQASVHYSGAVDNTHNPDDYHNSLAMLTGVRRQRLVLGEWVQAEGAVYGNFSLSHNVAANPDDADYLPDHDVYWGVDDGYVDPRFIIWAQIRPYVGKPDRLVIFDEYVATREISGVSVGHALSQNVTPDMVYHDPSAAEFAATCHDYDLDTWGGYNKVEEGINLVRSLIEDAQGERLIIIHPRCTQLIEALANYRYKENHTPPKPEHDVYSHGADSLRYIAATIMR